MTQLLRYTKVEKPEGIRLLGVVLNDSRADSKTGLFIDNHRIYTSCIVKEYESEGLNYCVTETGTVYELGTEYTNIDFYNLEKDRNNDGTGNHNIRLILNIEDKSNDKKNLN